MDREHHGTVGDYMVKEPVSVEPWQPVARARQLMLMHSFSFLPVFIGKKWMLVSETAMAKYLRKKSKKTRLANTIEAAATTGEVSDRLALLPAKIVKIQQNVTSLLEDIALNDSTRLWLVVEGEEDKRLVGVLSPFELL